MRTALALGGSNIANIDDWPHKRVADSPTNVLLLAIPFAEPEKGVLASDIDELIFDPTIRNPNGTWQHAFPPGLVVGFFDASDRSILFNPDFELDEASHDQEIKKIKTKKEARLSEIEANRLRIEQKEQEAYFEAKPTIVDMGNKDNSPIVW